MEIYFHSLLWSYLPRVPTILTMCVVIYLLIHLSILHPSFCPFVHLQYLSIHPSIHPLCISIHLSFYPSILYQFLYHPSFIYPSIFCLSIHPFNHPFVIYPPIHPSSLYSYPSTHLSIYLSIHIYSIYLLNQFIIYHLSIHPSIFCLSIHPTIQAIHPFIICPSTQPHLHPSSVYLSFVVSIYTVKSVLYPKRMLQVVMSNVIWYVSKIVFGMTESTCIP